MSDLRELLEKISQETELATYPSGYYSRDGDCMFFYNEGGEYVRHRVDGVLTVFRAPDDGRIMGLQVKGLSKIPGFAGLSVMVMSAGTDREGRQIDVVNLLFHSFSAERGTEGVTETARVKAYSDAARAFRGDVEVAGAC